MESEGTQRLQPARTGHARAQFGASRVVCCVRAPPAVWDGPRRPSAAARKRIRPPGQPRQRRFLAQHAPAKGPSNHSPRRCTHECNRESLKILAKLECYRLNTPQNGKNSTASRRAPGARVSRQLILLIESPRVPGRVVPLTPAMPPPCARHCAERASLAGFLLTHHYADHIRRVSRGSRVGYRALIGGGCGILCATTRSDGETVMYCRLWDLASC